MKHSPEAKMAQHDRMPRAVRALSNEFGFNAVQRFLPDAESHNDLVGLLQMWRANRQRDLLKRGPS